MKRLSASLCVLLCLAGASALAADRPVLRVVQTIPLPGVEGRIDHMAVDLRGRRLFLCALGNNTVEMIDLAAGRRTRTITGLRNPQGVGYAPAVNRLFVANAGGGICNIFEASTLERSGSVDFRDDADNIRTDGGQIYVGYGSGGIGIVDARTGRKVGSIPLAGHPEAFQLEQHGARIFVNVPEAGHIAVVDRKMGRVIATWPLKDSRANFPMALDEAHHRLFIGCRDPARLLVLDTRSGKEIARLPMDGDTDDVFYDAARKRIYLSCGAGFLDIFQQQDADHYRFSSRIPTAPGARTSFFVPQWSRLYVAVPHRGSQRPEIRIYAVE